MIVVLRSPNALWKAEVVDISLKVSEKANSARNLSGDVDKCAAGAICHSEDVLAEGCVDVADAHVLLTCIGKLANGQYIPFRCQRCRELEGHCGREHTEKVARTG